MAIFNEKEVIELLKKNQTPSKVIQKGRKLSETLKALIDGKNYKDLILKIEGIERSDTRAKARKNYSRSIVDLNRRLMRPLDNVYSATGGNKIYNIKNEKEKIQFLAQITNIRGNKSLEKWLQKTWMPVYHTDPNGVIFVEYVTTPTNDVYPTYKSINKIRNYKKKGTQKLEWIIFEPDKVEEEIPGGGKNIVEYYRVVDEKTNWRFRKDGNNYILAKEKTFKHPFGEVPGLINSDISEIGEEWMLSPFDPIIDTEKEYLRDQSILTIFKFQKGLSLFWRYKMRCPRCHGLGKTGEDKCKHCDGTGWLKDRDITDEIILPVPKKDDVPLRDIAGFISPDIETWNQYRSELSFFEIAMYETQYGSHYIGNDEKTATAKWIDTQPVINKLNEYSDTAEYMEWQLTEWIGIFYVKSKKENEHISMVTYGRRYIIESADTILEKYNKAKADGSPITVLDRLLIEYITSKYKNDPEGLRMNLTKKELEYYVHMTLEEVNKIFGSYEAKRKSLFVNWWETLSFEIIKKTDIEKLQKQRDEWIQKKIESLNEQNNPGQESSTIQNNEDGTGEGDGEQSEIKEDDDENKKGDND